LSKAQNGDPASATHAQTVGLGDEHCWPAGQVPPQTFVSQNPHVTAGGAGVGGQPSASAMSTIPAPTHPTRKPRTSAAMPLTSPESYDDPVTKLQSC